MAELPGLLGRIGLRLSPDKTRLTHLDEGFEFLGFRIQRKSRENKKPCVYTFVSDEALASIKAKIKALTGRATLNMSLRQLIMTLNPILRGWAAYFRYGAAKRTFSYVGYYAWRRVMGWLRKKHPKMTWKQVQRRYGLPGPPQDNGVALYNPAAMRVLRYRYRGYRIATPWEEIDSSEPTFARRSFDETEFLGRLQEGVSPGRRMITGLSVESRMNRNVHVRFGGCGPGRRTG